MSLTGFASGYYKRCGNSGDGFCGLIKIDDYKSYYFCPFRLEWIHDEAFAFAWENTTEYDKIDEAEAMEIISDWKARKH